MIKHINFKTAFYKEDLFTKFKIKQCDTVNFAVEIEDAPESLARHNKARILLRRADKTVVYEEIDVQVNGKVVSFEAPNGMTTVAGTTYGELEFSDDETYMTSTFVFVFDVVSKAGRIEDAIETSDEIFIIKEIREFINAIKDDLNGIKDDVIDLEARQDELDKRMEEVFEKAERLIEEVAKVDVNLDELIAENERAEENIETLGDINKTAQELKDMALEDITNLRNEAVDTINRLGAEATNVIGELRADSLDDIKDLRDDALEQMKKGKNEAVSTINTIRNEAVKNVKEEIADAMENIEVNIESALEQINDSKDSAIDIMNEVANDGVERVQNAVNTNVEAVNYAKEQALSAIRSDRDEALEDIETDTLKALNNIQAKYAEAMEKLNGLDSANIQNINQAKEEALETINTLKDEVLSDMEAIKEQYIEDISNINVDINTTLGHAQNILQALRDENALSLEWIERVEDAIERAKQAETEVDNVVNIASDLASELDSKMINGNALNDKLARAVEQAKNASSILEGWIGDANDLKPELEELLLDLEEIKAELEALCETADEKATTLGDLFEPADVRIEALQALIDEARRYEVVVRNWIDAQAGNHDEIEERLDNLERAVSIIEEKLKTLATGNISGVVENVVVTNWDTIPEAIRAKLDDVPIPSTEFKSVFVGKMSTTYDVCVAYFSREIEVVADFTVYHNDAHGDRYLTIKDYKPSDIVGIYYLSRDRWEAVNGAYYGNWFGGEAKNYPLVASYYHNFPIYDQFGNMFRTPYGTAVNEFAVNDFNDAVELNNYRVTQKAGETLGNTPIQGAYTGVLEVEITDNVVKQELATEDGTTFKRMRKAGSWTKWEKSLVGNDLNGYLKTNAGTLGEGILFPTAPDEIKNFEMPNPYGKYPQVKHKLIYSIGSTYYIYFFFCDLSKENGRYITYEATNSTGTNYNKFIFNGSFERYKDYVMYSGAVDSLANNSPSTLNAILTSSVEFRMHHFDFNIYNADSSAIKFNAPTGNTIKSFNDCNVNGVYPISMKASELASIANAPAFNGEGDVKGNLEVLNGVQTLTINSHNKTFVRTIRGIWRDITDESVSKNHICDIKVANGIVVPDFLKSLPLDQRAFNEADKKMMIFKKTENEYTVFRAITNSNRIYTTQGNPNGTFYTNVQSKYTQTDTYNALTGEWTTSINNSGTYTVTLGYETKQLVLYHSDFDIYNNSSYSKLLYEKCAINFNVEKSINNFNKALEVGTYRVLINEGDAVSNSPVKILGAENLSGILNGVLTVKKAGDFIQQVVANVDNGEVYTRVYNGSVWTNWTTTADEIGEMGNVKMTEFHESPITTEPNNPDANTYLWKFKYKDTSNYYWTIFFKKNPEGYITYDDSIAENYNGRIRYLVDTTAITSSDVKMFRATKTSSWSSYSSYPPSGMTSNSNSYGIDEIYYHNFNIMNPNGSINRYNIEENVKPGTANDANKAIKYDSYKFNLVEGDGIQNMPVVSGNGILINDFALGYIKQEAILTTGDAYIRVFDGSSWTEWKQLGASNEGAGEGSSITTEQVEGMIQEAVNGIEIPEVDLSNYDTSDEVDTKITEAINNIPEADLSGLATKDELRDAIGSIDIPEVNLEGLATKEELRDAIDNIEMPEVDLSDYTTNEQVDNKIEEAINSIDIPSVDGLVNEERVEAMIAELIGAPRRDIIEQINTMIGGI